MKRNSGNNGHGQSSLPMLGALGLATVLTALLASSPTKTGMNDPISAEVDPKTTLGISSPEDTYQPSFLPKTSEIRKYGQLESDAGKNKVLPPHTDSPGETDSGRFLPTFAQKNYRFLEDVEEFIQLSGSGEEFLRIRANSEVRAAWDRAHEVETLFRELENRKELAWGIARSEGWSPVGDFSEDGGHELMAMIDGVPYDYVTDNANAAISSGAREAAETAAAELDGNGVRVGIWDQGAVRGTHRELSGRVEIGDGSTPVNHATHAGGTIAASGLSASSQGMAPAATLVSHNWSSDLAEMTALAMSEPGEAGTIQISSHSYGFVSGWAPQYSPPRWYGNAGESEGENFGLYDWYAAKWDELCYRAPYYLPFKSSGNNRIDDAPAPGVVYKYYDNGWQTKAFDPATDPADDGEANGGYDTIPLIGNAKNVMTVGAVSDAVADGRRSVEAAEMTAFSGWGPTDDGRIKPDIVANGSSLYSTKNTSDDAYGFMSGTSMSTPSAAGSAALLVQLYGEFLPGNYLPASALKGLIIHTADDLGTPGPDYQFGWGLMNTLGATRLIEAHQADPSAGVLRELTVRSDQVQTFTMNWDGSSPIRATLCWTDPAGQQRYALDDRTPRLVNDLDLRLLDENDGSYAPYLLDPVNPSAPAATGDNLVDNVEQVRVDAPAVAGVYRVVISAKGELRDGVQQASLVVSGLSSISEPPTVTLDGDLRIASDGSGRVILGGQIRDTDSALCALQVECSSNGGASWHEANIAEAHGPAGPGSVDNEALLQVQDLAVAATSPFSVTWDSAGGAFPVTLSVDTMLRVRAWDGAQFSDWIETDLFQIDNVGPDGSNVEILQEHRAFGRYVVESSYAFSWSNFVDETSTVVGYYLGVNDADVGHALYQTNQAAVIQGLQAEQESTIYLWAVDGAGNLSDAFTFLVYPLHADGYWDGTGIPDAAFAQEQSLAGMAPTEFAVQMDMANRVPILRWPYEAGREYAIEYRPTLRSGPEAWTPLSDAQFSLDSGWVVWANRDVAGNAMRAGFYRVSSN